MWSPIFVIVTIFSLPFFVQTIVFKHSLKNVSYLYNYVVTIATKFNCDVLFTGNTNFPAASTGGHLRSSSLDSPA